jgi:hypothetical protein
VVRAHGDVTNAGCNTGCDIGCNTGCDIGCNTGCDIGCDTGCDTGCNIGCKVILLCYAVTKTVRVRWG